MADHSEFRIFHSELFSLVLLAGTWYIAPGRLENPAVNSSVDACAYITEIGRQIGGPMADHSEFRTFHSELFSLVLLAGTWYIAPGRLENPGVNSSVDACAYITEIGRQIGGPMADHSEFRIFHSEFPLNKKGAVSKGSLFFMVGVDLILIFRF